MGRFINELTITKCSTSQGLYYLTSLPLRMQMSFSLVILGHNPIRNTGCPGWPPLTFVSNT